MEISFYGAGCVRLAGKKLTVVCDPFSDQNGLGRFNIKADVVTLSAPDSARPAAAKLIFDSPGEYEVQGSMITGVPAQLHVDDAGSRCTMYSILLDGVNVAITGSIAGKLSGPQVEALGQVDVLVVSVGDHGLTMDAESAAAVISQLEPAYVIPVHYDDGKTTYPVPQDGVEVFLKEMGVSPEPMAKLKISAGNLPEETQIVVLKRAGE